MTSKLCENCNGTGLEPDVGKAEAGLCPVCVGSGNVVPKPRKAAPKKTAKAKTTKKSKGKK